MLSASDADLVRRDPAIPGLGFILDPDALHDQLASLGEVGPSPCGPFRPAYIRYKPGTSCMVAYRTSAGEPPRLYAVARNKGSADKLTKALLRAGAGPAPEICVLPEQLVEIRGMRADPALPSLRRLIDGGQRTTLLAERFHDRTDLRDASLIPLAYKPERRFVGRLQSSSGPGVVIRLYTPDGFARSRGGPGFHGGEVLRIARRVGRSDRHNAVLLEWLPGRPLRSRTDGDLGDLDTIGQALGAALAELHRQKPRRLLSSTEGEAISIQRSVAVLGVLQPRVEALASRVGQRVLARLNQASGERGPVHGDFHIDQVVLMDDGIGFLDFDRARVGDPASDIGRFLAHLETATLDDARMGKVVETFREGILHGYDCPEPDFRARVRLHTAAELLQLAIDPFRYRAIDWDMRIEATLLRAGEVCSERN